MTSYTIHSSENRFFLARLFRSASRVNLTLLQHCFGLAKSARGVKAFSSLFSQKKETIRGKNYVKFLIDFMTLVALLLIFARMCSKWNNNIGSKDPCGNRLFALRGLVTSFFENKSYMILPSKNA